MRLLILSATREQDESRGFHEVSQHYKGQLFREIAQASSESRLPRDVGILVLSAAHGLVMWRDYVDFQPEAMTEERAKELAEETGSQLDCFLRAFRVDEVFVALSKDAKHALRDAKVLREPWVRVIEGNNNVIKLGAEVRGWLGLGKDEKIGAL